MQAKFLPRYESHLRGAEELRPLLSVEIDNRGLVIKEFESGFVGQGAGAIRSAAGVAFPAIRDAGESIFPGQAMHCAQLHDVQPVIESAGYHGQARAGLLV